MQTASEHGFDNPTVELSLYMSDVLASEIGDPVKAENNAVMLLEQAFTFANLNYDIHYDFPIQDYPAKTGLCDEPFGTWLSDVLNDRIPLRAKDSNVLLFDSPGGGCANDPDNDVNACVVGGDALDQIDRYRLSDQDYGIFEGACANALLHEVAHTLGYHHEPPTGYGFVVNGSDWWKTPDANNDTTNTCGEPIEPRPAEGGGATYMFYHWCSGPSFDLVGEQQADPPSEYPPRYNGNLPPHSDMLTRPPEVTRDDINILQCQVSTGQIRPGETVTLFAILTNDANQDADVDVIWRQNGQFLAATTVTIPAGGDADPEAEVSHSDFLGATGETVDVTVDFEIL